jgi:hypothetical protein
LTLSQRYTAPFTQEVQDSEADPLLMPPNEARIFNLHFTAKEKSELAVRRCLYH